jgi:hypothetical protein
MLQQQTDLSSDELPQGLVGLVHYCNGATLSIGSTGWYIYQEGKIDKNTVVTQ